MAHTDSCEQGFACNAYYKLYYYIKLFRKVKQFFKKYRSFCAKKSDFPYFSSMKTAALLAIGRKFV